MTPWWLLHESVKLLIYSLITSILFLKSVASVQINLSWPQGGKCTNNYNFIDYVALQAKDWPRDLL